MTIIKVSFGQPLWVLLSNDAAQNADYISKNNLKKKSEIRLKLEALRRTDMEGLSFSTNAILKPQHTVCSCISDVHFDFVLALSV